MRQFVSKEDWRGKCRGKKAAAGSYISIADMAAAKVGGKGASTIYMFD